MSVSFPLFVLKLLIMTGYIAFLPQAVQATEFSSADETAIVDHHNELRRDQGASNMEKIEWDNALASKAQELADSCHFGHDNEALAVSGFDSVGQNIYAAGGDSGDPKTGVEAVDNWYEEVDNYNLEANSCSDECGHYTQVVWATSNKIGCARAHCPNLEGAFENAWYIVCNYGPAGNMNNERPFLKGAACSECPDGMGCDDGLCGSPGSGGGGDGGGGDGGDGGAGGDDAQTTPSPQERQRTREPYTGGDTLCDRDYKAATFIGDTLHLFKDDKVWRVSRGGSLLSPEEGEKANELFLKLRSDITAAFESADGTVAFFRGPRYYIYKGQNRIQDPKRVMNDFGLLGSLSGAVRRDSEGKTFFFKGPQVWRYDELSKTIDPGYPREIARAFDDKLKKPSIVFADYRENIYFVKYGKVFRVSRGRRKVDDGYPKPFAAEFINQCEV